VSAEKGLTDADLQLIDETVALIRTYSLAVPKSTPAMADDILRSYIRSFDQYGDFLTRKQYQAFLESNNADYFGVEMDIEKKNDHIYLYPFKNGMAEKHGIRAGDELIAVNGAPVYGKSIFLVGSTIRGAEGAPVQLTI
jgi:carboxyl-terminal processing protease